MFSSSLLRALLSPLFPYTTLFRSVRANVYVASTDTKLSGSGTDFLNMTLITVTIPPSRGKKLPVDLGRLQWRGLHFFVQGQVVPIMALGRVDHFQITATTAGGAG